MSFKPRPYQEKAIQIGIEVLKGKRKEVLIEPTGAGKSWIIGGICKELSNDKILVIQPTFELLEQNISKINALGVEVSVFSASAGKKETEKNLIYATLQSLTYESFKDLNVKYVIVDECFTGRTPIVIKNSSILLKDLYNKYINNEKLPLVESYNTENGKIEYKKIVEVRDNGIKDIKEITLTNKTKIETTLNHPFLTVEGWKKVKDFKVGDVLITTYPEKYTNALFYPNEDQFDLIIGSSLGDGCFDRRPNHDIIRISMIQGEKQKDYLYWKANMLNCKHKVEKINNNGYSKKVAYKFISHTTYFKRELRDYINQINKLNHKSLSILWMDDGHLSKYQNSGSLYSLCDSEKLVTLLNNKLLKLGIRNTIVSKTKSSSTGKDVWYIKFRKQSVIDISKICAKYIHKNLEYKIVDKYKHLVGSYEWDTICKPKVCIISDIKDKGKQVVYNMEIEDNHTYSITNRMLHKARTGNIKNRKFTQGGLITHNCDFATQPKTKFIKLLTELKIKSCLGLTASPFYTIQTNNGAVTEIMTQVKGSYFKDIANIHQIQDMVENKYWSNFQYFNVFDHSKEGLLKLNDSGSEFTELSQKEFYDKCDLKTKISDFLSRLPENENALVFVPDIEKAEELKELIPNSVVVHSKVNKKLRKENVDSFKNNNCRIAITPLALAVGFDKEDLFNIVDATPTNSVRVNMQKIGRICRLHKDKELGRVIDFSGNFNRFGDIRNYTFENIKGYGWVLLNGENVLTGIPMDKAGTITKEYIVKNGKPNFEYIFDENNKGDAKMSVGKYAGKSIKWLYYKKRFYLKWLIQVDYNFKEEDKEFERQLKQIFKV